MKTKFAIRYCGKTVDLGYVYKVDNRNFMIVFSDTPKKFASAEAAQAFIDTYAGAGYGLAAEYCRIEEV